MMKKLFFFLSLILFAVTANAQEASEIKPAAKGVVYGEALSAAAPVSVNALQAKMTSAAFEGKVTGKVKEVCKSMGCWITLEKADGTTLMVKSRDHSFFMPQDLVGRTVVIEGTASEKVVTEDKRRHLAEDAGKSKAEIKKIKGSVKEVQFIAKGVEVLD